MSTNGKCNRRAGRAATLETGGRRSTPFLKDERQSGGLASYQNSVVRRVPNSRHGYREGRAPRMGKHGDGQGAKRRCGYTVLNKAATRQIDPASVKYPMSSIGFLYTFKIYDGYRAVLNVKPVSPAVPSPIF